MITHGASSPLPPRLQAYLSAIIGMCAEDGSEIVSLVLFGSAAGGGFSGKVSDVDLILILRDGASQQDRRRVGDRVTSLEILHGLREPAGRRGALEVLIEAITANDRSFFVCTRGDLLSGSVSRILNLRPAQALFVDRIVISGILSSAVTVWGEQLLAHIPLPPIRRLDVFKALFGLYCSAAVSLALFPLLPRATRYAMAALKHSLHSCYFCYHGRSAALTDEVGFFQPRIGASRALEQLMALRDAYTPSLAFVARCIPALVRLHLRTALDNRFPDKVQELNP